MSYQEVRESIMVVDDQPANLNLLEDMLQRQGYKVRSFPRGRMALAAALLHPPDLILLDINMPEMDGYEVCERMKSNEKLSRTPVIFLSALSETVDKVRAFRSGGVDYITKPFHVDEVQARVETHIQLHRLQRELREHKDHLEELVDSRTRELAQAHARLKTLDQSKSDFLNLISHEFRSPLNGILGTGELLLDELGSHPDAKELREMFEDSRRRIMTILEDALLLTQIEVESEKFPSKPVPLASIVSEATKRVAEFARSRQVFIQTPPAVDGFVLGEQDLLVKALHALLETAVKVSKPAQGVGLECLSGSNGFDLVIETREGSIPAGALARFFDIFSIGEAITTGGDLGLGPPVAYRILSLFGGSITIENRDPSGIRIAAFFRSA